MRSRRGMARARDARRQRAIFREIDSSFRGVEFKGQDSSNGVTRAFSANRITAFCVIARNRYILFTTTSKKPIRIHNFVSNAKTHPIVWKLSAPRGASFPKTRRVGARWRASVITRRACTRPFAYSHNTQRTCARVDCFRARRVAVVAAARERALTARRRFARFAVFHENVWSR